ncbi:hypothetical protein BCV72DRAFT_289890 [Rhizopus microsporus var. microsporus]|uniref:Uncharacterized protein n=1 Tax=Rhizopus microsporus var. microsporus TaxID=86635 RepID=A0A1X0R701_RHIZD|nr:hypothetical protein BCV72DRAFT_289890 [Rhizopus microsporus var. microsporus]
MFQFWSEWRRKGSSSIKNNNGHNHQMVRTCSVASNHSTPSNWSIDWTESKKTLSFKDDYVSFPSLEPTEVSYN